MRVIDGFLWQQSKLLLRSSWLHFLCVLTCFAVGSRSVSAAEPTTEINPRWEVSYGKSSCDLIRYFSASGKTYRLKMTGPFLGPHLTWRLHGEGVPSISIKQGVKISVPRSAAILEFETSPYMVGDGTGPFIGWADEKSTLLAILRENPDSLLLSTRKLELAINVSNSSNAVKAYRQCEDDLFSSWGYDPKVLRLQSVAAIPVGNPGRWATNDDYPRADFNRRNEGIVTFLLDIDAAGVTTRCRALESSGFPTLDQRACELLIARAKFQPARNADGEAMATIYVNRIRWQVPR